MMDFDIFVRTFNNDPKWKLDQSNSKFVVAKTTSGVPIYLYANRPLANTPDEDYVAQNAMQEFFEKNNLSPTVTFHRGHSYHAPTSVSYITPTNRVVFMGSCGGFFLIDSILKKSSDAHIISSKQTGYRDINLPFIRTFLETLRLKKTSTGYLSGKSSPRWQKLQVSKIIFLLIKTWAPYLSKRIKKKRAKKIYKIPGGIALLLTNTY